MKQIHPLQIFPQIRLLANTRLRGQARLVGLAILVGIVAGLGAILFTIACQVVERYTLVEFAGYEAQVPHGEARIGLPASTQPFRPWMLLVVPTVGGVLCGLIVYTFAPEAEGHGTDAVISAYHNRQGEIRPRVPLVKILASAITLGTGGSGGREGPIAQVGAGFGSLLANFLHLRPVDRRILVAAGMGAGIAAIFRAPLAGALFAAEVLYCSPEFEPEVIIPAGISSVIAYTTFGAVFGWEPLFATTLLPFNNPWQLGPYLALALVMIVLATVYVRTFYGLTHLFHRLPVTPYLRPALGAFGTGLVALALYYLFGGDKQVLGVLSFGYGFLQDALTQTATAPSAWVLLAVALGKILTTSLTIGSGGSAGVFGASMVIGGSGAAALGILFRSLWPDIAPEPVSFAIVGMAGFFAAAAKTPFSTIVMVSEITADYNLLLPALWVCSLAFLFSGKHSIYSAQVRSRAQSHAHQGGYIHEILAGVPVKQFLTPGLEAPVLHPEDPLAMAAERFCASASPVLPVVDGERRLLGVVSLEGLHLAAQSASRPSVARELMQPDVIPLETADRLDRAVELFIENDLPALPVIEGGNDRTVRGIVRRADVASTYLRIVHGEMPAQETSA